MCIHSYLEATHAFECTHAYTYTRNYLPSGQPTYLPPNLITKPLPCVPVYSSTHLPACQPTYLHTYALVTACLRANPLIFIRSVHNQVRGGRMNVRTCISTNVAFHVVTCDVTQSPTTRLCIQSHATMITTIMIFYD